MSTRGSAEACTSPRGDAYQGRGDNGNRSAVHRDLVLMQAPQSGGGEIWFAWVLMRKDRLFVLAELEGLRLENLGYPGRASPCPVYQAWRGGGNRLAPTPE